MHAFGLLRRFVLALLTGYIFVYFSEYAFYARPLDGARLPGVVTLVLLYSFCAYAFLTIVSLFSVRSVIAVFLAGALYGWLVEGVFVQTMYESLPLSISFTGLAWHAILTILGGWLGLQSLLRRRSWWLTALVSALAYGAWGIWWWIDEPPATWLSAFATYVFVTTAILAYAYWLASRPVLLRFTPSRAEVIITALLILLYFAAVTVPVAPIAALILPPLALLVLLALRKTPASRIAPTRLRRSPPRGRSTSATRCLCSPSRSPPPCSTPSSRQRMCASQPAGHSTLSRPPGDSSCWRSPSSPSGGRTEHSTKARRCVRRNVHGPLLYRLYPHSPAGRFTGRDPAMNARNSR